MPEWSEVEATTAQERETLVMDHVPLLRHIVGRMALDLPGRIEREDLMGYGMIGLLSAADAFDPGRGLAFSTFAYSRVRGAILDELRRADFLPRGRRERVRALNGAMRKLEQKDGCKPSLEQVAAELEVGLEEVDEILLSASSAAQASLDDGDVADGLRSFLRDPKSEDPVESAEWNEMKDLLVQVITELSDAEQTVITLYYSEELLLREIGDVLGVTESRASQIHSRALYRLNRALSIRTGAEPAEQD
ncbi:MAG: RNA polymerase sigma factor for flagellar operon FliA [Planctomycetota bacterium]